MSGRMCIAGCGPGAPDYVTPAVKKVVQDADVLVGAQRLLDLFPESEAERVPLAGNLEGALDTACRRREKGRRVCVLVTGSPGVCSLASTVLRRVG
ncbi:MAG: SAM-dependent methyltransferase, partial [Planctomycetota bacterium]